MKTNLKFCKLIVSIIITVIPLQIIAQETKDGTVKIDRIATISEGLIGEPLDQTSLAQLKRSSRNNWLDVKKNDELYFNDILKLDNDIWLKINIKNKRQDGSIALFQGDLKESAQYQFTENPLGSRSVGIDIKQGSAVVQVRKDKIITTTNGIVTSVQSGSTTRALFNVYSDGSGDIYLQQGNLLFPGITEESGLKKGEVAHFKDGQIIRRSFPDIQMVNNYEKIIKYNNSTIWKKPFLKQPLTWIGAAMVVGTSTALIITKPWDKKVTGTININWGGN